MNRSVALEGRWQTAASIRAALAAKLRDAGWAWATDEEGGVLLLALPEGLDAAEVRRATHEGLRSPWLGENTRRALADAITALSQEPRLSGEETKGKSQ